MSGLRILRKFCLLSLLIICLGWIVYDNGSNSALAAPCCETCDPNWESCLAECPPGGAGVSCRNFCNNQHNSCLSHCTMCGGGPTGGQYCMSDGDCPIGCGCVMGQNPDCMYAAYWCSQDQHDPQNAGQCNYYRWLCDNAHGTCSCPGGGGCSVNGCPIGQYCAADDTCQPL